MTVTDDEFKQLKDLVSDLASHIMAVLDMLEEGLAAAALGNAGAESLSNVHARIQRNKSHIADVHDKVQALL
jgi:hypothetical protein